FPRDGWGETGGCRCSGQPDAGAIRDLVTGQRADEAPMGDHGDVPAVGQVVGLGAKRRAAPAQAHLAFRRNAPPALLETAEVEVRPEQRELLGWRALVAGEHAALAHERLHRDRQIEPFGDDGRGFESAPIGTDHQSPDLRLGQLPCQLRRLAPAGAGQRRIGNAGVDARAREMPVPLRLGVTHQNHGRRPQWPRGGGMSCSSLFSSRSLARSSSTITSYSVSMVGTLPRGPGAGPVTSTTCASIRWRTMVYRSLRTAGTSRRAPTASVKKPGV